MKYICENAYIRSAYITAVNLHLLIVVGYSKNGIVPKYLK